MTAENLPRFDIAALKRLAGGAYVRGEAYHRDGRVEILAVEPRRVLAQVAGTEDYRVNLLGKGETIKGECTCRLCGYRCARESRGQVNAGFRCRSRFA